MSSKHKVVQLSGGYIIPRLNETYSRKPFVEIGLEGSNDFFDVLIKRYQTSATNQACIDGSTDLLFGKGILFPENPELTDYFYNLTSENDIRKIIFDYKLYGNSAIQVHFSEDRQRIIGFYHTPTDKLRAEKCDEKGNIRAYYYCTDWKNPKLKATRIPAFNSGEYEGNVQIFWLKRYTPGQYYYSTPDYFSGIQYCAVEEEISNLHINNILNNFLPTSIINFNAGLPPEEEQFQLEADIKNKFVGSSNAGRFITSFNENPEYKTTIESIPQNNIHENYKFLSEEATSKIMIAHRITSQLLFGIRSAAGFSSNAEELKVGYDVFNTMVIAPMQKELLDAFKLILSYNSVDGSTMIFDPLVPFTIKQDLIESVGNEEATDITQESQQDAEELAVNEHIKNLTGKQLQGLQRIVRKFNKGELTYGQAKHLIKASFAMADSDIELWLGEEELEINDNLKY